MPGEAEREEPEGALGIHHLLRTARARAGMTRRQLALASGTSERYLAHLEAGEGNPTLSVIEALAGALNLAPAELLPLGGERNLELASAAAALRRLSPDRVQAFHQWLAESATHGEKSRRIVLIGLRGAGKSSLGVALARRLDFPFLELTKEVEQAYGGPIATLIELLGQPALRRYEREAWERIRSEFECAVVAAPGSVVADGLLYERMLASAHSIWLRARPEDHMSRVMAQGDFRPMASNRAAMADLKAILDARAADYAKAETSIDTSAASFDATALAVERAAREMMAKTAI